jgi:O-antigen/teichoic acid export membrane protein
MKGIRRALVLNTSARYFILAANFFTLAIVSRILTLSEIGVSVLCMAIVGMAFAVREFATTNFIVQRHDLKPEHVRTTYTVLLLVSGSISFLIWASAGTLANLYDEPRVVPFLNVFLLSVMVEVVGAPIGALLSREMAFGQLSVINIIGAALFSVLTITFALLGFSYMSFAWARLVSQIAIASLFIFVWPDKSIFKPCLSEWRSIMTFGGYNGATVLLFTIYDSLPYAVFGRILSVDAVALYHRSIAICQLPDKALLGGVGPVLLPAFSAEVRNGGGLREHYLRSVELITGILWPALILTAILAEPIVQIVLGDQWLGAVPLVRIIAIAYLFLFSFALDYPVFAAVGAMRDLFVRGAIVWPISAVVITSAAFFGLKAAALSLLITAPFQAFVSICFVRRHVDISWRDIVFAVRKSAGLMLCGAIGPLLVVMLSGGRFDLSMGPTIAAIALGLIGWGAGLRLTRHPLLREIEHAMTSLVGARLSARSLTQALRWENANR